jgi:hypothetical protein
VTIDPGLAAALAELGGRSRSRAVRDLAVRGAQALVTTDADARRP